MPIGRENEDEEVDWIELERMKSKPLLEELQNNRLIREKVPLINRIVAEVEKCGEKISKTRELPTVLDKDSFHAVVLYTHDLMDPNNAKSGNFYYELNKGLRNDSYRMERWGNYLKHFIHGLAQLDDWEGTCYRGMAAKGVDLHEYVGGTQIVWDAFSSATRELKLAKVFMQSKEKGIIFKIETYHGKDICQYSIVTGESEVLLDPRLRYMVTRGAYEDKEGYKFIDLHEVKSKLYQF